MNNAVPNWLAIVAFAVPLFGIAGSAVGFVVRQFADAQERRHERFFRYMEIIDSDSPLVMRLAAIYRLRDFTEHREFLLRFLERFQNSLVGTASDALAAEMRGTADALKKAAK